MTASDVRMIVLSTDDLDRSIDFYAKTLGFSVKFRDGDHFATLDGGSVSVALATLNDHPIHGRVVVGVRTDNVEAAVERVRKAGDTSFVSPTTTHTSGGPSSSTTRATGWFFTSRFPRRVRSRGIANSPTARTLRGRAERRNFRGGKPATRRGGNSERSPEVTQ